MKFETVKIFISSTFSDMHAERDYLVEYVFPQLREWCEKRRLYLIDIDLRWGVSRADSTANNTIRVCLERIDECRPFFLCFLGQRRGSILKNSEEALDEYPELREIGDKYSATELEVEHALLAPMLRIVRDKKGRPGETAEERKIRQEKARRALFFLRDNPFVNADLSDLQKEIYTNAGSDDPQEAETKHQAFRELVRESCENVTAYQCCFDREKTTPELRGYKADDYPSLCAEEGRLTNFTAEGEPLCDVILRQLKEMILKEYPDRKDEAADALLSEDETHSLIKARYTQFYFNRKDDFADLDKYLMSESSSVFLLSAQSGAGKSTLLANFADKVSCDEKTGYRIIMRFCGVTRNSISFLDVLRSVFESQDILLPPENGDFLTGLDGYFAALSEKGKTLIILDDVTRTAEGVSALKLLPQTLPRNIRLIASVRETQDTLRFIEAIGSALHATVRHIKEFDKEDKDLLIKAFLDNNLKALDKTHIEYLCALKYTDNTLYLNVILRELRTFGSTSKLRSEIELFGKTPEDAFSHLLDRLAQRINDCFYEQRSASDYLFGLLCFARAGIKKSDLRTLMTKKYGTGSEECLEYILRCPRDYLSGVIYTSSEIKIDFLYDSFKRAAQARYGSDEAALRNALAEVFEFSDPEECSFQLRMAGNADRLTELYSDPAFLTRFCKKSGGWRLAEEADLLGKGIINSDLSDCFRTCAQAMTDYPEKTPQILYKEAADPVFRQKARALIHGRWLRFEPAEGRQPGKTENSRKDTKLAPYLENRYNTDAVISVRCFSPGSDLAFLMLRPGVISVFRMSTVELLFEMAIADDSPEKILVTGNGKYFAIVSSDCTVSVFELIRNDCNYLLQPVHEDECLKVRFKGMCAYAVSDALVWQTKERQLTVWKDGRLNGQGVYEGQLTGVWQFASLLTVWKEAGSYILRNDRASLTLDASVNDIAMWNDQLYIAVRDSLLYVADPVTLEIKNTIRTDNPLYTFAGYDGRLLATDEEFCLELIAGNGKTDNLGNMNYSNGSVNTNSFETIVSCGDGIFYCSDRTCAKLRLKVGEQTHAMERFFNAVKDEDRQKVYETFEGQYRECRAGDCTYKIEEQKQLVVYSADGERIGSVPLDENLSGQYVLTAVGKRVSVLTMRASVRKLFSSSIRSVLAVYEGKKRLYRKEYDPNENIVAVYPDGGCLWVRGSSGFEVIDCDNGFANRRIPFDFTGFSLNSPAVVTDSVPVLFRTSTDELCAVSGESGDVLAAYPMSRSIDSLEQGADGILCFVSEHGKVRYKVFKEDSN